MSINQVWSSGVGIGSGLKPTSTIPIQSNIIQSRVENCKSISCSADATYLLDKNGKAYSFGNGQLGFGKRKDSRFEPELITETENATFSKVFSSSHKDNCFVFLLTEEGSLFSFGNCSDFKTGLGTEIESSLPRYVSGFDSPVVSVSLGISHGVVITKKQSIYLWGQPFGFRGDIYPTPTKFDYEFDSDLIQIVSGECFTLFLTKSGKVYGIGDGESTCLLEQDKMYQTPIHLDIFNGDSIIQISAGDTHCLALSDKKKVYSWGSNKNGSLGLNEADYNVVVEKPRIINELENIIYIYSSFFSSFVIQDNGDVYSWGYNVRGNLGRNHTRNLVSPEKVIELNPENTNGLKISDISLCENYTLFLLSTDLDGEVPTPKGYIPNHIVFDKSTTEIYPEIPDWFLNKNIKEKQIWCTGSIYATGNEMSDDQIIFKPMSSLSEKVPESVAIGYKCGYIATNNGEIHVWGSGFALGQGTEDDPCKEVTRVWDLDTSKIVKCYASIEDVCIVQTDKGSLYSWGRSLNCLTGLGREQDSLHPRLLEGFKTSIIKVVISSTHVLALDKDGAVYAWGSGKALGNRNRSSQEKSPKKIQDQVYFAIDIAVGTNCSFMLSDGGQMFSWGEGVKGQLGLGENKFSSLPTNIKLPERITAIASSNTFATAVSETSQLYVWGDRSSGLLDFIDQPPNKENCLWAPVLAPRFTNQKLAKLVLTEKNCFALTENGSLFAWGQPHLGLGTGLTIKRPTRVESTQTMAVLDIQSSDWQGVCIVGPKTLGGTPMNPPLKEKATIISPPTSPTQLVPNPGDSSSSDTAAVPDNDDIQRHEAYLKSLTDELKFWTRVDPENDINTWCGKIVETKEFLNRMESWHPDPNVQASIQHAQKVVPSGERIIKGWIMFSINFKDYESIRIYLVTTEAIHRIKYDWKKLQVIHDKVFPLTSIYKVKIGKFSQMNKTISNTLRAPMYEKEYGVQVWFQDPSTWKPPMFVQPFKKKVKPPFITFRPATNLNTQSIDEQELICAEIGTALQCAIHYKRNGNKPIDFIHKFARESPDKWNGFPPFPVRKVESVQRFSGNGLLSYTHNKFIAKTQNGFTDPMSNNNNNTSTTTTTTTTTTSNSHK
eukprot:gene2873-3571_t